MTRALLVVALLGGLALGASGCARAARGGPSAAAVPPAVERGATPAEAVTLPPDSLEARWRARLARDPADAGALTRLSRLMHEQGRHAEAVTLLAPVRDGSVKLGGAERAAALGGLALHEAALGRDGEALGVLKLLPDDALPAVSSYLAARGARADSALTATERALRAAPESAALRNNRGIALLRSGDADAAQREFERAIALDPARPGPYYNLAILEHFYRLDTAAARRWFQAYWSRSHADPDSLFAELGTSRPARVAEGSEDR
jgi:tetratricopeptide (TPR) repeat protein